MLTNLACCHYFDLSPLIDAIVVGFSTAVWFAKNAAIASVGAGLTYALLRRGARSRPAKALEG